jgi:protein SCO1/2
MAVAASSDKPQGFEAKIAALSGKPVFWLLLVLTIMGISIGRAVTRELPKPPALKLPLASFELTNQRNQRVTLADLRGKVWVADFVFTSCPTVCPKLTKDMARIQHRTKNLGQAFNLVTFTVDPENDTPERLAAYAAQYHADPTRWIFLTGKLGDVETTIVKGFKIAMGKEETEKGSGIFTIFHGEKLVLVDQEGMIRGYYDADDDGIKALIRDADILVNLR